MKSNRGTVIVETELYKDSKARMPVLRTILDVLAITGIWTFILCNKDIPVNKNVLLFLDIILGFFSLLILVCLGNAADNYRKWKKFYAEADVVNKYEFFANCVGMYQRRNGHVEGCEILYFWTLLKKWETKKYICFMSNQYDGYYLSKSGLEEDELNAIRAALGLPYSGEKMDLPTAELKIAPFVALIHSDDVQTEQTEQQEQDDKN